MAFGEFHRSNLEVFYLMPYGCPSIVGGVWRCHPRHYAGTLEHRQRQRMGQEQPCINYASIDPTNFIKISSQCCEDHFEFSFPLKQVKISDYNNRNRKGMVSTLKRGQLSLATAVSEIKVHWTIDPPLFFQSSDQFLIDAAIGVSFTHDNAFVKNTFHSGRRLQNGSFQQLVYYLHS